MKRSEKIEGSAGPTPSLRAVARKFLLFLAFDFVALLGKVGFPFAGCPRVLEGVGREFEAGGKHKARRKQEGAFYTPAFITRYIIVELRMVGRGTAG